MRTFAVVLTFALVLTARADWWDSFTDTISSGLVKASTWVKDTASPAIREKFDDAKETLQDPETHKTIREWLSEKAEKVSDFAQTEVIPELKKIYDAATTDDASPSPKKKTDEIVIPKD